MSTRVKPLTESPSVVAQMRPALVKFFLRKTGNFVEAEDLAHDVLANAFTHADGKTPEQAKGYIFRAAVNRWRDRHRRLQARGRPVPWDEAAETAEHGADDENSIEHVFIVNEELDQIAHALEELNVRTRAVLMLIRLENLKIATVAEMLGISVSAVNKHLAKAVAHLAETRRKQDAT